MSKQTEMKYNLEKFEILDENLDSDFALCKIYICSTGKNLHGIEIALEAMIQAQESLKNKYLVAKINKEGNDFEGHEFDERIIGHFPESSQMEIVQYKNRNFLIAQALISKVYASKDYFILSKNNNKGVSMEIKDIEWDEDFKVITNFSFHGVTVLGDSKTPAIPNANLEIMVFESNQHYEEYIEKENVDNKNYGKEGNMAKKEDIKDDIKKEKENKTYMETNKEQEDNNDNKENIEENKKPYEDLEKECNSLKEENSSLKEKITSYETKEKADIVNSVLYTIENSGIKDKKVLEDIKKEAERFTLDNINDYYYIAKGMAFSYIQEHGIGMQKEKDGITKFAGKEKIDFSKEFKEKDPNIYG